LKPAAPGEILVVLATGLGPTKPGVDPGQAFPAQPLNMVNSPVSGTLGGKNAEVLYAGGYPGTTDLYQVNLKVPADITPGTADLRLSAAWQLSAPARIQVGQ
jgi:uncharacterized protein (TIGR03437 family)